MKKGAERDTDVNWVHYSHSGIGRSTHAAGTAAAHVRYISGRSAAVETVSHGMGDTPAQWLEDREHGLRANARVAEVIEVALPCELTAEQRSALVAGFARAASTSADGTRQAPFVYAIHRPSKRGDQRNLHAHLIVHDRGEDGRRVVGYSERGALLRNRVLWAEHVNHAYRAAGLSLNVDHRSYEEQGRAQVPTIHVGVHATDMLTKGKSPRESQSEAYVLAPGAIAPGTRAEECNRRTGLNEAMRRELRERAALAAAEKKAEAERQARIDAEAAAARAAEDLARRQAEAQRVAEEQARQHAITARRKAEAAEAARQAADAARRPVEAVRGPSVPVPPPPVHRPIPRTYRAPVDPMAAAAAFKASQQAEAARQRPAGPIPAPMAPQRPQEPAKPVPGIPAAAEPRPAPAPGLEAPAALLELDPRVGNSVRRQKWLALTIDRLRQVSLDGRRAHFDGKVLPGWAGMSPPAEAAPTWTEVTAIWRWCTAHAKEANAWLAAQIGSGSGFGSGQGQGQGPKPKQRGD